MKDTFFFSHDYNTRTDAKIKKLVIKHGMAGYGIFWAIVEDLYNNANALRMDCEDIAVELRTKKSIVESILFDFGLFNVNEGVISSNSVQNRLDKRIEKSNKAAESAQARWEKKKLEDANALRPQSDSNAIKESKGKESKQTKEINVHFDVFWDAYDKKQGRLESEKIWQKMTDEERDFAISDIPEYKKTFSSKQYQKLPASYLHQKTWLDRQADKKTGSKVETIPEEVLTERKLRESKYDAETMAFEYLRGKAIKFPDRMSVFHVNHGFANELRQ